MSGRIIDSTGHPIRGALVQLEGGVSIVVTDRLGRFQIVDAPIGATIIVNAPGFETALGIASGPIIDEIVMLTEKQAGETIEVKGEAPPEAPGAAKLDREELQRIPGTGNDVVRTLTAMPGVVNFQLPIGYSGVVIRGSSPQDSKILVDDFEVPTLYHDIGFRSIIPTEAIDKLDYIPGGFDVAFGRASSGIVNLTTRPGSDKTSEQAEVSVIDGGVIAQGSAQGGDTHYLIAFRRSTIDLIFPYLIPSSADLSLTEVPAYYDEQLRIDHKLSAHWDLRLSSVGSNDELELFADKTNNPDKRFYTRTRFIRVTGGARYHDGPWSANLAISTMLPEFEFDSGAVQHVDVQSPSLTGRGEVTRTFDELAGLKQVTWRFGGEAVGTRNRIELALPQEVREGQPPPARNSPNDTAETFDGIVWTPDFAEWMALSAALDPRIKFTVGLRVDEFARIHDFSIQPRGELAIKLSKTLTARLSSGGYVRPPEYQTELLASNVHPEKSTQVITGLEYEPREGTRIQTSFYYTDRTDLLVYAADGKTLINNGRGTTYGAELLATHRQGPWFAWLAYSYSHSTRVDNPGDPERLFDYDQPHSLNAALSWRKGKWQLGGRFQLYSGLPYTPVTGSVFNSDTNSYIPIYGPTNSQRAPIHHELDIRVDRYFKWGPAQMSWFVDIQNVYLDQSVAAYFYSYDYTQQTAFKSIPIIPSIGLRGVL